MSALVRRPIAVLALGAIASGSWVAWTTFHLEPVPRVLDRLLVAAAMIAVHLLAALPVGLGLELVERRFHGLGGRLASLLALVWVFWCMALPATPLPLIGSWARAVPAAGVAIAALLLAFLGALRLRPDSGWVSRLLAAGTMGALVGLLFAGLPSPPEPPPAARGTPADRPDPVVLLVIDGLDPGKVEELAQQGRLPTLARLLREGTSAPLITFAPTVSPSLWTTLATGQASAVHGIHDFVNFRFPGAADSVRRLPHRSGWRHRIFPALENWTGGRLFGRAPYTANMRRAPTIWEIAHHQGLTVGVYRWLVTWPAEPVRGFVVPGSLIAYPGPLGVGARERAWHPETRDWMSRHAPTEGLRTHPAELGETLEVRRRMAPGELAAFLADPAPTRETALSFLQATIRDPTSLNLAELIRNEAPDLVVAAFHSVDLHQHQFASPEAIAEGFGPAIDAAYEMADRRLAELLPALAPRTRLLVVSDHGFDFELGHHLAAPPGLFLAVGPGFAPGGRAENPSVFDIAPLVLALLELPVGADLPAAPALGRLLPSGSPPFSIVGTWTGLRPPSEHRDRPSLESLAEADRDLLQSVGYID